MASGSSGGEEFGAVLAATLQIVFSLTFPVGVLVTCLASYVLGLLGYPEFSFWTWLAELAIAHAQANIWLALGLGAFVLAALPLAWVALRERELSLSGAILDYVLTILIIAFVIWLRTVWPYHGSPWQTYAYAFLLFLVVSAVVEVVLDTIGIIVHLRANRPIRPGPPPQHPHGNSGQDRPHGEPETL